MKTIKQLLVIFMIGLMTGVQGFSQEDPSTEMTDPDSTIGNISSHSLFTGLGYGSNMIYLGSTISQDQPYGFGSLTYGFKDKLYASVSAVHLGNRSPFVAFYTLGLNYSQVINSWFDISAGASRYQVAPSLTDTLFGSFNYADLTLGFDWKILYTKLSAGGLIADGNSLYLQARNSRFFQTPGFSDNKYSFSFDPYINFLFGSLTTTETSTGTVVTGTPPFRQQGNGGQTSTGTHYETAFGLMEIDLGIPIAFNAPKFTIEAEPGYILPMYDDPEYPGVRGFVFILSGFFRIF
jgi:hypothetical protein